MMSENRWQMTNTGPVVLADVRCEYVSVAGVLELDPFPDRLCDHDHIIAVHEDKTIEFIPVCGDTDRPELIAKVLRLGRGRRLGVLRNFWTYEVAYELLQGASITAEIIVDPRTEQIKNDDVLLLQTQDGTLMFRCTSSEPDELKTELDNAIECGALVVLGIIVDFKVKNG